jgi:prepilin-type processing-associated H-X9-DG protein
VLPIVLGIVAVRRARRRTRPERLAWGAILGGALNLLATPVLINVLHARQMHDYGVSHAITRCASSLRQIGVYCLLYSNDHHGQYPTTLKDMIDSGHADAPETFTCYLSNDAPAATFQQLLHERGHVSYVYIGAGLTSAASEKTVVAYDRPTNHDGEGRDLNILYGDGHVERISKEGLQHVIREIESGHNPPRPRAE